MNIKRLLTVIGLLFVVSHAFSQDLIKKVPKQAQLLATLNNKVFFDNLHLDTLNATLNKVHLLDKLLGPNTDGSKNSVADLGIDLNQKAYMFFYSTDSVRYLGGLIPLANRKQFEALVEQEEDIIVKNGMSTIETPNDVRITWDDHTIYILSGFQVYSFFENEDVMNRYGLVANAVESDDTWSDEVTIEAYEADTLVVDSTAVAYVEEVDYDTVVPAAVDEYAVVDSILAKEEYSDDYYQSYNTGYDYNYAIKDSLVGLWVQHEFDKLLSGADAGFDTKLMKPMSKNTLGNIFIPDFPKLMFSSVEDLSELSYLGLPRYLLYGDNGGLANMKNLYFMKSYDSQLDIINNQLKTTSDFTFSEDFVKMYKDIYKKGVNPKFYKHLDKDVLAFASININTEAYLKELPAFVDKFYGPLLPNYQDAISLGTTIFDIVFDEKAISKVFKGDNLLLLNGVVKTQVTYKDYEYDDDYNATEVEKTKMETIPQFLWMFTSEDNRIYNQIIKLALKEEGVIDLNNGIYQINTSGQDYFKVYIQAKDGVVYVGNNLDKMNAISTNTVSSKGHPAYVSLVKKNVFSFVFNTKRIPTLVNELELPVDTDLEPFMQDLSNFGDFKVYMPGFKGNTFKMETTLDFPKSNANVLLFINSFINRIIDKELVD